MDAGLAIRGIELMPGGTLRVLVGRPDAPLPAVRRSGRCQVTPAAGTILTMPRTADDRSGGSVSRHHRRSGRRFRAGWRTQLHQPGTWQEAGALSLHHSRPSSVHRASPAEGSLLSVYKPKKSPYYHFDIQIRGYRFHGSTGCTTRKEAEAFEAVERDKAKALVKAMQRSRTSLLIDDVAARLWNERAQHDAAAYATSTNLARLVEYFGKTKPLTDIDHSAASKMVAWRRGHHVKGRADAPLISNSTVNRSTTKVLQRLFTFAKAEGAVFEHEPKWSELYLPEPAERVRELQDDEAVAIEAAIRDDYGPFFDFVRASGLRQIECITLRWSEVNFGTRQIVRVRQGRQACSIPDHRQHPRDPVSAARPASRVRASPMSPPTTPQDGCAGNAIRSRSTGPDRHGGGCEPSPGCRISASMISGMTSAPSCCAIPAISSWCRRP